MSEIPSDLKYCESHEWVSAAVDGIVTVGITDHAQEQLGDLVFVELPEVGASVTADGECAVVESVKAASDVYSPVNGEVVEVNQTLTDAPETINSDPYGGGWIFKVRLNDKTELDGLLDAEAYGDVVAADH